MKEIYNVRANVEYLLGKKEPDTVQIQEQRYKSK